jgi:glutamate synthase domain-containing protein 2
MGGMGTPIVGAYCVNLDKGRCICHDEPWKCGICLQVCPQSVYVRDEIGKVQIVNDTACVGCRICQESCPTNALHIKPAESEANTRHIWDSGTVEAIHHKALTGEYTLRGLGTMGPKTPHFDSIIVIPSQLASEPPKDKYREECNLGVVIGEDTVKNPIRLKVPIIIAGMSFGALSREAKMSLAIGAALSGTITNTGEGGMLPEEAHLAHGFEKADDKEQKWKPGGHFVVQWSTGRWGVNLDYLQAGDAVEIKIGQGAKPGMGGHLLGTKVTEEVSKVRGIPIGTDALSPCRYYDVLSFEDLKHQVEIIKDMTDYKVPILLKLGPSRPYKDVKLAVEAGVDAISIDGMVGGTGCSPELVTQGVGVPTITCIAQAVRALKDMKIHRKVKLFAMGGIRNGLDAFKAMAIGADGVGIGAAAEIALGCRSCMACHTGSCRYGLATGKPELRHFLDPFIGGQRIANFIKATTEEIKILSMLSGHDDIRTLTKEDVRALDLDTAAICGIKHVGIEDYYPEYWGKIED